MEPLKIPTPEHTEQPFPGLVVDWYQSGRIIAYQLTSPRPEAVERWAKYAIEQVRQWPLDQPYLAIHDLSQPGISLQYAALVNFEFNHIGVTPEGSVTIETILDARPRFRARVALNFSMSLSGQTNRTLMNFFNREQRMVRYRTFYSRAKCLDWLLGSPTDTREIPSVSTS